MVYHDVVCLQEIKCTEEQSPIGRLSEEYPYIYFNSCDPTVKKGYSGVVLLSKTKPLRIHYGLTDDYEELEGRAITVEYDNYVLINTYTPNSGQGLKFKQKRLNWNASMTRYIANLRENENEKPVIWTGDLNCAYHDYDVYDGETNTQRKKTPGFTPYERAHFGQILESGMIDAYRQLYPDARKEAYTFFSIRGKMKPSLRGWRLDYYLLSPNLKERVIDVENIQSCDLSDHTPLILTLKQ